ncbi:hypothetical protein PIROE2DRAFT_13335 [Piromyces sp. E2]|nr:hypothetical protein PIROE2DRAFT_13335 [Piromyces sp. E2]|eukprot:OUM60820.1 hypothetical protein PIROE2DRAFT_13335 [Piromyces sp. E2]
MSGTIPDYLKKDFDPNSLTIPQLRSILKDHEVDNVPAPNQPKRVFIKLFNNEIAGNREAILKKLNIPLQEKKKAGRPRKSDVSNVSSESLKPDLPRALRGKSESPAKETKNKRVSFGMKDIKQKYESPTKKTTVKSEIKNPVKEEKKEKKPLIQNTINKLNEEHELNKSYIKSYNQEQSGIKTGNVKRARQKFNEDNKPQTVEIKKSKRVEEEDEEPSPKKRKQSQKTFKKSPANTSSGNIFQNSQSMEITNPPSFSSSSSKIPKAHIVFAEDNDDEEEDDDYVYQSNSPSMSTSSEEDDIINDEEMADLERDSASSSNINFSEGSYQEQLAPLSPPDSGVSTPQLDNINYAQVMSESSPLNKVSKLEKPKSSTSFSYDRVNSSFSKSRKPQSHSFSYNKSNNSFAKANRVEKPHSQSFTYNRSNTSFSKSKKLEKTDYSPFNTSFNDKPKINISYDMSPIQSSHDSMLYDDTLLNQGSDDRSSSNVIGNLYESLGDDNENEPVEINTKGCSGCSIVNILAGLSSFIVALAIGLFSEWYIRTGGFAGYCKLDTLTRSEMTYLNTIPENSVRRYNPFYHLLPKCLNCPDNAICINAHVIDCKEKTDILKARVIRNIIPTKYLVFPLAEPYCAFDYEKRRDFNRKYQNAKNLMNISIYTIRKELGIIECNQKRGKIISEKEAKKIKGVSETRLHTLLKEEVGSQIREESFDKIWNFMTLKLKKYNDEMAEELCYKDDTFFCDIFKSLKYIPNSGDTINETEIDGKKFQLHEGLFVTSEKPIHTLRCRFNWFMERYIYNHVYDCFERYWRYGVGMVLLAIFAGVVNCLIKRRTRRNNVINSICEEVIWLLQEAEYQHKEDPLHFPSPNVSVAQLYDILLPTIISAKDKNVPEGDCVEIVNNDGSTTHYWIFHNPKERALVWKRVYEQVRANSNVLESNALVKRESHRCWEWIGNPALNNRRKSPNTINKQTTTYYPKVANNSRLSLGGSSSRSFNSQQFAGDISAISNVEGNGMNESYMTFNEDGKEADTSSIKGQISKISIFNSRRESQIMEERGEEGEGEEGKGNILNEPSNASIRKRKAGTSSLYPNI